MRTEQRFQSFLLQFISPKLLSIILAAQSNWNLVESSTIRNLIQRMSRVSLMVKSMTMKITCA